MSKLEFSHYIFNDFCSFLVHFLYYLSLKQFTKCIFWRLVLHFPAAIIGKDWKQVDNLEGVQRCSKEPCALCLCPNNSVLMKWWESYGPLKLGLGGKVRLSGKLWSFYSSQAEYISWPGVTEACSLQRHEPRLILVPSSLGLWFTV